MNQVPIQKFIYYKCQDQDASETLLTAPHHMSQSGCRHSCCEYHQKQFRCQLASPGSNRSIVDARSLAHFNQNYPLLILLDAAVPVAKLSLLKSSPERQAELLLLSPVIVPPHLLISLYFLSVSKSTLTQVFC